MPNVQKLERRLATEKQRNKNLERRVAELQRQLDGVSADNNGNEGNLKAKVSKLADRARTERELRGRADKEVAKSKEQVEVLTEHIETLMMQLKQQTSAKSAALKELSSVSREIEMVKSRSAAMSKRNARKDALINDLRNESAALDSELQSMQAKYGELRLKVDWTRSQTTNTLKKKNEEIEHLQTKLEFLARKDRVLEGMNSSYEQKSKVINRSTHTGRKTVAVRRGVGGFRGGYSP
jgi:chromosome segregation ATPase